MFFKSKNKGFSLVELVVIIAILAVFAAILTPSLLQYTENSRAQKDVSAMDEVVNAVQLALADEKCFDEALKYSCTNNYLTYSDSSGNYGQQINDGEFWAPDGSGRATTITFNPEYGPNNQIIYDLSKGIVNDMTYGNGSVAPERVMEGVQVENSQCYLSKLPQVYNMVRQTVGNDVITTSQTYRNSSFTVFIRFNQKDNTTVADVSGSFNGTNLYDGANASKGSGTSSYDDNGDAITTVTTPGTSKSEYTSSALSGTGSFGGSVNINNKIEDYQQPTYVENLQKENKCEYYSSIAKAAADINNGTPGTNGDATKDTAVACVYVDEAGTPSVIILKSGTETEPSVFNVRVNIILGGTTTTYTNSVDGIYLKEGGNIDGRIKGSKLSNPSNFPFIGDNTALTTVVKAEKDTVISGGEYELPSNVYGYTLFMKAKYNFTIKDATVTSRCLYDASHEWNSVASIFYNGSKTEGCTWKLTVDNCDVYAFGKNKVQSPRCINLLGSGDIVNTRCKVYGDIWSDGTYNQGPVAIYCAWQPSTIKNCDIYSTGNGIDIASSATTIIQNSTVQGCDYSIRVCDGAKHAKIINTNVSTVARPSEYVDYCGYANYAIYIQENAVVHQCEINGSVCVRDGSNTYISLSKLSANGYVYSPSKVYLGARNNFDKTKFNNKSLVEETGLMYENFTP